MAYVSIARDKCKHLIGSSDACIVANYAGSKRHAVSKIVRIKKGFSRVRTNGREGGLSIVTLPPLPSGPEMMKVPLGAKGGLAPVTCLTKEPGTAPVAGRGDSSPLALFPWVSGLEDVAKEKLVSRRWAIKGLGVGGSLPARSVEKDDYNTRKRRPRGYQKIITNV